MKKILILTTAIAVASNAYAQNFIGGLDFDTLPDVSSDIAFDTGISANNFTLNIQTGSAEDNFLYFGSLGEPGWGALGDPLAGGASSVGASGSSPTVFDVSGFTPSTSLFGGTSAVAQGFSDTAGISFGENTDGIFTINLLQPVDNTSISFDYAALAANSQSDGTFFSVNDNDFTAGTSAVNSGSVTLGNLAAGESIQFQFPGSNSGVTFDNFMISGTVVPEPGTYAAIVGLFALGFVIYRRRCRC